MSIASTIIQEKNNFVELKKFLMKLATYPFYNKKTYKVIDNFFKLKTEEYPLQIIEEEVNQVLQNIPHEAFYKAMEKGLGKYLTTAEDWISAYQGVFKSLEDIESQYDISPNYLRSAGYRALKTSNGYALFWIGDFV